MSRKKEKVDKKQQKGQVWLENQTVNHVKDTRLKVPEFMTQYVQLKHFKHGASLYLG